MISYSHRQRHPHERPIAVSSSSAVMVLLLLRLLVAIAVTSFASWGGDGLDHDLVLGAAAAAAASSSSSSSPSDFRFARSLGDSMVLRGDGPFTIWGFGHHCDSVQVRVVRGGTVVAEGETETMEEMDVNSLLNNGAVDDGDGDGDGDEGPVWIVRMPPVSISSVPAVVTATCFAKSKDSSDYSPTAISIGTISIEDVLFGSVWLCGGQSNMQFPLNNAFNSTGGTDHGSEIARDSRRYPHLRTFMVGIDSNSSSRPLEDLVDVPIPKSGKNFCNGGVCGVAQVWSAPSNSTLPPFSAVCWYFGTSLADTLGPDHPIGLVMSSLGGTRDEAWSTPEGLRSCHVPDGEKPENGANALSVLYNGMIHPLMRTTISGAVWYQGEADATTLAKADRYACTLPRMIADWRYGFSTMGSTDATFPFGIVQLCSWGHSPLAGGNNETCPNQPTDKSREACEWAATVRRGQMANRTSVPNDVMPNTFLAVTLDLADTRDKWFDVHPRDKRSVGRRLAFGARDVAYGDAGVYWSGPIAVSARVAPGRTRGTWGGGGDGDEPETVLVDFENVLEGGGDDGAAAKGDEGAATGGLILKHSVGFEVLLQPSPRSSSSSLPAGVGGRGGENDHDDAGGDWMEAPMVETVRGGSKLTNSAVVAVRAPVVGRVRAIRYNHYQSPCMPSVGENMCAVYSGGLPAPPFLLDVTGPPMEGFEVRSEIE